MLKNKRRLLPAPSLRRPGDPFTAPSPPPRPPPSSGAGRGVPSQARSAPLGMTSQKQPAEGETDQAESGTGLGWALNNS